jgi:mRNA-degrading endonuclease toxin of MazEF toxin-antitoxin module
MNRGDVVLVRFPHPSGQRGKKRPAVVVQSDAYTGIVGSVVVAGITKNLSMAGDPACLLIDSSTSDGKATGVNFDCVVSCLELSTVYANAIAPPVGTLSPAMKQKLNDCLKAALALP